MGQMVQAFRGRPGQSSEEMNTFIDSISELVPLLCRYRRPERRYHG